MDQRINKILELEQEFTQNTSQTEGGTLYTEEIADKIIKAFPEMISIIKELWKERE